MWCVKHPMAMHLNPQALPQNRASFTVALCPFPLIKSGLDGRDGGLYYHGSAPPCEHNGHLHVSYTLTSVMKYATEGSSVTREAGILFLSRCGDWTSNDIFSCIYQVSWNRSLLSRRPETLIMTKSIGMAPKSVETLLISRRECTANTHHALRYFWKGRHVRGRG